VADWKDLQSSELRRVAEDWLATFSQALEQERFEHAAGMIHADGYWRDLLTFSWDFRTVHGPAEVQSWLVHVFSRSPGSRFRVESDPTVAAMGVHRQTLEFFFLFETETALGRGYVRLVEGIINSGQKQAFTLLTTMKELKGFPERTGRNRPREDGSLSSGQRAAGHEERRTPPACADGDPDVIIVGAGQAGLMLAARLRQLNINTLVVEKSERVGDVWRKRYRSLKLHNDVCMNHFPYLPFPETWPVYLPKDKLADWFEFYAKAMELNVATSTTLVHGEFDPITHRWTAHLKRADGTTRIIRPRHLVMALGVAGLPSVPKLPGMDAFSGIVVHSSGPTDDLDVEGKIVLVVGAGTSAHDIAQNFCLRGADVTMLQRSSVTVVSLEPSSVRAYQWYRDYQGLRPIADIDMMGAAVPFDLLARLHGPLSRSMQEADKELLDGLRKVGFLLDNGEDDTGYFLKFLRHQAGYYLNIGASELIVEGKIKLKASVGVERLTAKKVILTDGSACDADILVLATGYEPFQEHVRALFGSEVADRIGPIWGIGQDGELRNMYAPTAQENFFVLGGGLPEASYYSQFTALYIKADLEGMLATAPAPLARTTSPKSREAAPPATTLA
jgi:putative flavoprotein involved in K+ transport